MCWLTICCLPERYNVCLALAYLPPLSHTGGGVVWETLGAGSSQQVLEGVSRTSVNQEVLCRQTCR